MSCRLVPNLVTLNDLELRNGRYFALFHRIGCRKTITRPTSVSKPTCVVYDHIKTICAIIQRLFGQNKLVTRFDGRRCIDD